MTPKSSRRNPESFLKNIIVGNLKILQLQLLIALEEAGPEHLEDPSNKFLKLLNMCSISSKQMRWTFLKIWNMGSMSIKNMK